MHAAGFIHRDIKAGNVMREEGGRILLMDFGLTHEQRDRRAIASGTPAYMAPELMLGQPATIASDVYAIGVLLFYLLTTQYPVEGADARATPRGASLRHAPDAARRSARSAGSARPRGRDGDQPGIRQKRFASAGQMVAALSEAIGLGLGDDGRTAAREAARRSRPGCSRRSPSRRRPCCSSSSAAGGVRTTAADSRPPVAGMQEDYRRAHDLLAHYYRPQALETAIPLLEKIVAAGPAVRSRVRRPRRAPTSCSSPSSATTKYIEPARDASLRALALAPDLASAHVTLGFLYAFTAQNDLASHEIDSALRLDKFNARGVRRAGGAADRQGRTELVEATLQKAVSLAPDDWILNMQLGEHYLDNGKWAQAGEQFRRAWS